MKQLPIPEAALTDTDAVEMLRVWIADQGLHCSLKVGLYKETTKIPEERAWGTILADAARHLAQALEAQYGTDANQTLRGIRDHFNAEVADPTSETKGGFVRRH
jgi:hypothetical protein